MTQLLRTKLQTEIQAHTHLRQQLVEAFPSIDDETLTDTLEGLTSIDEILIELVRSALEDEGLAASLSTRLNDMKARQKRLAARANTKRALALRVMVETEIKSLTDAEFSAFVRRAAPSLEVSAEEKIPPEFWKPQPARLDRLALLEALKDGAAIEGAALAQPQHHLSVRTR